MAESLYSGVFEVDGGPIEEHFELTPPLMAGVSRRELFVQRLPNKVRVLERTTTITTTITTTTPTTITGSGAGHAEAVIGNNSIDLQDNRNYNNSNGNGNGNGNRNNDGANSSNPNGNHIATSSREVIHFLQLGRRSSGSNSNSNRRQSGATNDAMLPLYALATSPRLDWSVELIYGGGTEAVEYPLRSRDDVSRLQALVTGCEVVATFENVDCKLTYKSGGLQHSEYEGHGEVQLWWPTRNRNIPSNRSSAAAVVASPSPPPSLSPTSSSRDSTYGTERSSQGPSTADTRRYSTATATTSTTVAWQQSAGPSGTSRTLQTDPIRGRMVALTDNHVPQPLLVLLLRDQDDDRGYTMLRMKLDFGSEGKLGYNLRGTDEVHFEYKEPPGPKKKSTFSRLTSPTVDLLSRPTFGVHKLSADRHDLKRWNLCDLVAADKSVESLKSTFLSLYFNTPVDPYRPDERDQSLFELELLRLKQRHMEEELRVETERIQRSTHPGRPVSFVSSTENSTRRVGGKNVFRAGSASTSSTSLRDPMMATAAGNPRTMTPWMSSALPGVPVFEHSLQSEIHLALDPSRRSQYQSQNQSQNQSQELPEGPPAELASPTRPSSIHQRSPRLMPVPSQQRWTQGSGAYYPAVTQQRDLVVQATAAAAAATTAPVYTTQEPGHQQPQLSSPRPSALQNQSGIRSQYQD